MDMLDKKTKNQDSDDQPEGRGECSGQPLESLHTEQNSMIPRILVRFLRQKKKKCENHRSVALKLFCKEWQILYI